MWLLSVLIALAQIAAATGYAAVLYIAWRLWRTGRAAWRVAAAGLIVAVAVICVAQPAFDIRETQALLDTVNAAEILPEGLDIVGKRVLMVGYEDAIDVPHLLLTVGGAAAVYRLPIGIHDAAGLTSFAEVDARLGQATQLRRAPSQNDPALEHWDFVAPLEPVEYELVILGATPPNRPGAEPSPYLGHWLGAGPETVATIIQVGAILLRPAEPATTLAEARPLYFKTFFQEELAGVPLWPTHDVLLSNT